MTVRSPFVPAGAPDAQLGGAPLTLQLEICRLQAELEVLDRRIGSLRSSVGARTESEVGALFADRAEELVERMVQALRDTGRREIDAVTDAGRQEAAAVLRDGRRRADELLVVARGQLATALEERSRLVDVIGGNVTDVASFERRGELRMAASPVLAAAPAPVEIPAPSPIAAPIPQPVEQVAPAVQVAPIAPVDQVAPSAAVAEEWRADAAFDAWLAADPDSDHGPEALGTDPVALDAAEIAGGGRRARARWVVPVEVLGALLISVIAVVLVLVLVG